MIKKIIFYSFNVVCFCILYCGLVTAYGDLTHRSITLSALDTTNVISLVFRENEIIKVEDEILKACVMPDYEETGFLFKSHFYDTKTWFDGLNKETAFKYMYDHFNRGITFWKQNKKLDAVRELGKSMHYMEDMCCVLHLTGWTNPKHIIVHKKYENEMDKKSPEFSFCITKLNLLNKFNFRETIDIRGTATSYSRAVFMSYTENSNNFPKVRFKEFGYAHNACCELIYLFFKEVGIEL